ncbi:MULTISPECIES: sugar-binding domain-containing protein [unclassified Flavobacterium]|uniref:sugar-binding domain-containing protein n=1 Tax=unclassified Flavobacterium TaxID=196869 RepID=UPI0025BA9AE2|nr:MULTISPECIES: sugar-binding domain-containing protein [unclassified Flavobacterium]
MKKMKSSIVLLLLVLVLIPINTLHAQSRISLAGEWKFATDSNDKGISEHWFTKTLSETIQLPGSMSTNDKGDDITVNTKFTGQIVDSSFYKKPEYAKYRVAGNIKIPFWLQSVKYYVGAAWYQKEVIIPDNWKNQNIELFLERCHWETRLWIDNKEIGMRNSLGTPHIYKLSDALTPGKHLITICVDNRTKSIDPGVNSHSISDHTQTNWNGMVGKLFLEAKPLISIKNIQLFPDIQKKIIIAKIKFENLAKSEQKTTITLTASGITEVLSKNLKVTVAAGLDSLVVEYPMGDNVKLWSEFHPNIYTLKAKLTAKKSIITYETTFGMREIKAVGKQLLMNGKPLFLRGTLECAIFPKTGFPPTDKAEWLRVFSIARAHGLNHFRFHSWCPPEAAFEAADQTGFYLQVECSSWANQSTTIGDGKPFDNYLYDESLRMVEAYGNHPSFCMMVYGNEPGGSNQNKFLSSFVSFWKKRDSRRIYTSGAGWPNLPVNDYLSDAQPRIQHWEQGLGSIINAKAPSTDFDWSDYTNQFTQPMVSHEIGQWCVYPNFKEIAKYTGVVRAKNFEIFQETLKEHGMEQLADSFLLASGKLQALCYKADIEAALRTKDFGGFQLLDLHDFPGQGTALVGVLDSFWDEKGYISPEEYSRFCNSTVPLVRLEKRIYTNIDTISATVEVAHYGDQPMKGVVPSWKINNTAGQTVLSGNLPETTIELGNCIPLGKISVPLSAIKSPEKLILEVSVGSFSNSWDIWVYPAKKEVIKDSEKIKVVSSLDSLTQKYLEKGGSVLLTLKKGELKPEYGGEIGIGFSSIFWNTAWTKGQKPHTLGILCNPKDKALASFPTEYYSNWQWWDAMSHSNAIMLESISSEIKPIVRVIDDWVTNRSLALLFEVKVGKGKLLVSGIDFNQDMEKRPEAQQLLFSLKKYMASEDFNPAVAVEIETIRKLSNK